MGWVSYLRSGSAQRKGRVALHSVEQLAVAIEAIGQALDAQTAAIEELEQRVAELEARS